MKRPRLFKISHTSFITKTALIGVLLCFLFQEKQANLDLRVDGVDRKIGDLERQQDRNVRVIQENTQSIRDNLVREVQKQITVVDGGVQDQIRGIEQNFHKIETNVKVHDGDIRTLKTDVLRNKEKIQDSNAELSQLKSILEQLKSSQSSLSIEVRNSAGLVDQVRKIDDRSTTNLESLVELKRQLEDKKAETITILESKINLIEAEKQQSAADSQNQLEDLRATLSIDLKEWMNQMRANEENELENFKQMANGKFTRLEHGEQDNSRQIAEIKRSQNVKFGQLDAADLGNARDVAEVKRQLSMKIQLLDQLGSDLGALRPKVETNTSRIQELSSLKSIIDNMTSDLKSFKVEIDGAIQQLTNDKRNSEANQALMRDLEELRKQLERFRAKIEGDMESMGRRTGNIKVDIEAMLQRVQVMIKSPCYKEVNPLPNTQFS